MVVPKCFVSKKADKCVSDAVKEAERQDETVLENYDEVFQVKLFQLLWERKVPNIINSPINEIVFHPVFITRYEKLYLTSSNIERFRDFIEYFAVI